MQSKEIIKLIVTIVERRQGAVIARQYSQTGSFLHFQCSGYGTASSELLDVLGFGTSERDILLSYAAASTVDTLLHDLNNAMRASVNAKGIVFSIPLTAISNPVAAKLFDGLPVNSDKGEINMQPQSNNSLILVLVNPGHTDQVMDTAKQAGARGGTVIRARWADPDQTAASKFYGITVQSEKELLAIVATAQTRNLIMESINQEHGLDSEAGAILCSLGLDNVVRLN